MFRLEVDLVPGNLAKRDYCSRKALPCVLVARKDIFSLWLVETFTNQSILARKSYKTTSSTLFRINKIKNKYYSWLATLTKCFCVFSSIRLKEEQRWIGMPEWKKNLLRRRGTDRLYRDYHAINTGNSVRRRVSWQVPEVSTADDEDDGATRLRAISSLE